MNAQILPIRDAFVSPRSVAGIAPPADFDAEATTLSAALTHPDWAADFVAMLRASDFADRGHVAVAEAVHALHEARVSIEIDTLAPWLRAHRLTSFDKSPGAIPKFLHDLIVFHGMHIQTEGLPALARIVRDKARLRRASYLAQKLVGAAYTDATVDAQKLIDQAAADLAELAADGHNAEQSSALEVGKALARNMADRARNLGTTTGFRWLDDMTTGMRGGELWLLGARTAMGKTTLAAQIAGAVAREAGGVLFVELEMSAVELMLRQVSSAARVDLRRLRMGELDPDEIGRVSPAMRAEALLPVSYVDRPGQSVLDVQGHAKRAAVAFRRQGKALRLVVVDHVGLVRPVSRKLSREQEVGEISRGLKWLAKDLGVPVLALVQLSRDAAKGGKVRPPVLTDLRESGSLEQDADVVLLLHRAGYYEPTARQDEADLILAKQRNGPSGTLPIGCELRHVRFFEREGDSW